MQLLWKNMRLPKYFIFQHKDKFLYEERNFKRFKELRNI